MEMQAPKTFRKRTINFGRTRKFNPEREIARGLTFCTPHENVLPINEDAFFGALKLRAGENTRLSLPYSAEVGHKFFCEKNQKQLKKLYKKFGITMLEFCGSPLRNSIGYEYYPYLSRIADGTWYWHVRLLCRSGDRVFATKPSVH